jgi:hypothetical protein
MNLLADIYPRNIHRSTVHPRPTLLRLVAQSRVGTRRLAGAYIIMAALSVYLIMQTMGVVIYRSLILSIPLRLSWRLARRAESAPMIQSALPGVYQ